MCNDRIFILLTRKLSGEATLTELKELDMLVIEQPACQKIIAEITATWNQFPAHDTEFMEATYLAHLERLKDKTLLPLFAQENEEMEGTSGLKNWLTIKNIALLSVIFVLLFSALGLVYLNKNAGKENGLQAVNEIKTVRGSRTKVQLPDGSTVWLNAGSKLTYDKDFGKKIREVKLVGEGYFDVVKMPAMPFVIHTSNINIKVLGTVFNVKAYPDERQTETSLIKGSIEVTISNRVNSKIVLSPNEKLLVENEIPVNASQKTANIQPPVFSIKQLQLNPEDGSVAEAEWVNNRLVFNDETMEELVLKMQRWYNVLIEVKNAKLAQKRFTGNFEKEGIYQALDALKITTPFEYKITPEKIIIDN